MRGEWALTPSIDMSSCHDNKPLILITYAHPMISNVPCLTDYRVIFNEWKIVDSSESHLNHCLGLEIHLLGKFTSYILVLWYQTYHNVEK